LQSSFAREITHCLALNIDAYSAFVVRVRVLEYKFGFEVLLDAVRRLPASNGLQISLVM